MSDRTIAMMASEPFEFHGRPLAVFACFDATPEEAARLTSRRMAVIRQKRYQTADILPEPSEPVTEPEPTKKRRSYRRRDMKAETH